MSMNTSRAAWAHSALAAFVAETGCDLETEALHHLLCDLGHWADLRGIDYAAAFARAVQMWRAEKAGPAENGVAHEAAVRSPEFRSAQNPIVAAFALTPFWMLTIQEYDAVEVHPCRVTGFADGQELIEQCEPEAADFWSVYGHCRTGGLSCFEDFPCEAAANAFAARLRQTYPHLAEDAS